MATTDKPAVEIKFLNREGEHLPIFLARYGAHTSEFSMWELPEIEALLEALDVDVVYSEVEVDAKET